MWYNVGIMINLNFIHKANKHKVKTLVDIIRVHSRETYKHSQDVANISLAIGQALKLPIEQLADLYTAGLLHDIGKLSIRKEILHKKDCSEEEIEYIKESHIQSTKAILTGYFDSKIVDLCCHHHERLNGSGYPQKLAGSSISLGDRILHIADTISAMSLKRSYVDVPFSDDQIVEKLKALVTKGELDGALVDVAIDHMQTIHNEPFRAFDYKTSLAILEKASKIEPKPEIVPTMYVFAGPNASGKSTLIANRYLSGQLTVPYINADIITKYELEDIADEEERAKTGMFTAMQRVQDAINKKMSFTYETVLSHPSKIDLIRLAKERGYNIQSVFVCTEDPAINIVRLEERVKNGGHDVPTEKVFQRYERAISLSYDLQEISDSYEEFDNSESRRVVTLVDTQVKDKGAEQETTETPKTQDSPPAQ